MWTSQKDVPRIVFMEISAAITEKSLLDYISTNIADNITFCGHFNNNVGLITDPQNKGLDTVHCTLFAKLSAILAEI